MLPVHWLVLLRAARSHLPFPIEHQKQPGLHFEPSASPSGWVSGVDQQERNNSKGKYQGCICVLGTPCKYSTHRATLMVMVMVLVMGMAAPRPLCVTSPPTAATIRRTMQVHGQTGTKGGGGAHSTRAMLAVSAQPPHLYISALLAVASLMKCPSSPPGFLSINSRLLLAKNNCDYFFYFPSVKEPQVTRYTCLRLPLFTHTRLVLSTYRLSSLFGIIATVIIHTSRNTFTNHTT